MVMVNSPFPICSKTREEVAKSLTIESAAGLCRRARLSNPVMVDRTKRAALGSPQSRQLIITQPEPRQCQEKIFKPCNRPTLQLRARPPLTTQPLMAAVLSTLWPLTLRTPSRHNPMLTMTRQYRPQERSPSSAKLTLLMGPLTKMRPLTGQASFLKKMTYRISLDQTSPIRPRRTLLTQANTSQASIYRIIKCLLICSPSTKRRTCFQLTNIANILTSNPEDPPKRAVNQKFDPNNKTEMDQRGCRVTHRGKSLPPNRA